MLQAIEDLPEEEREAFDLVRIQGMTQVEAAEVLGVSNKTVQRRLNRALLILSEALDDLRPGRRAAAQIITIDPGQLRLSARRAQYGTGVENPLMSGDPRVQDLLEEILESRRTPEEVCQTCPELLPEVRDRLRRLRELEAQVDSLFPTPGSATGLSSRWTEGAPRFPATTSRRSSGAAGWASFTRRGTCA